MASSQTAQPGRPGHEKAVAAAAAAQLLDSGMTVGLGTGSTVAHLLEAIAARGLSIVCVATSMQTMHAARALGIEVADFDDITHLDITIDGTDQVDPAGWLVKGGGAAHTREKVAAATADRFVVIADSTKVVPHLAPPVPLELLGYGLAATMRRIGDVRRRDVPASPDGGVIADYYGDVRDPGELAMRLSQTAGVVEHGLFPPSMVSDVIIARGQDVEHRRLR
ncbi:MAG: ribose 5-phosphate isomerase A [Candidatus Nanopelagicales bacterium]